MLELNSKQVHFPYKAAISSADLQEAFNAIVSDIGILAGLLAGIQELAGHGFVAGCICSYNEINEIISITPGTIAVKEKIYGTPDSNLTYQISAGSKVIFDSTSKTFDVIGSSQQPSDTQVIVAQWDGNDFDYNVRRKIEHKLQANLYGDFSALRAYTQANLPPVERDGRVAYIVDTHKFARFNAVTNTWES